MNGSTIHTAARTAGSNSLTNYRIWPLALAAAVLVSAPAARAQQIQNWPADDNESSYSAQANDYAPQAQGNAQQPISPTDLTQLIAPIALYPDTLVAQILTASTYPAQVSAAAQWVQSMGNAPAQQIAAGANAQTGWDPSVKALTAFPQVLSWMAQNMPWTTALGNAYYNQPQDVMDTLQVMRQRAQDAGTLQSTPQQQVYEDQGAINIAPANPEVVYVPTYDPWEVYGSPINPYPGFAYYGPYDGGYYGFGPAVYLDAWSGWNWGWNGWGLNWYGHCVTYHDNFYWSRSPYMHDWGYANGGPRWRGGWGGRDGWGRGHDGDRNWGHGGNGGDYARNPGYRDGSVQMRGGPQRGAGAPRSGDGFSRGGPGSGAIRGRDGLMAGNRGSQVFSSPQSGGAQRQGFGNMQGQPTGRPSYGSGMTAQPRSGYMQSPGGRMSYDNPGRAPQIGSMPQSNLRAPMNGFGGNRGNYGGGQSFSSAPRGGYSAPSQPRSYAYGGNPSFGGRSYSAPSAPRSFNGGGSYGGGNRSYGSSPSFGGGGHSYSGGGGGGSRPSFSGGGGGHPSSSGGGGGHSFTGGGGGGGGHHR
ncbi:MAG: DUF3300 domain-containing protein [Terracidiphilus sp.]|nr:DUF3300 domain-containing protein [Terracidiphilus sp.]